MVASVGSLKMGQEIRESSAGLPARLSNMAMASTHGEDSPYFAGWKAYMDHAYDPQHNPDGIIQMGLAENQVAHDLLQEWVREHPEVLSWHHQGDASFTDTALFQDYSGLQCFREALANFMEEVRDGQVKFDPNRIVLAAGATAANELLTFCLADPGDALLVPTPFYPGFDRDLRWRTGVETVPVACNSTNNFQVTVQVLCKAYEEAKNQNINIRGILVTNPSNPLGTTISKATLEDLLSFAAEKDIHLICDEIYSGSVFHSPAFISIAQVLEQLGSPEYFNRVHIVYSLSKDLGIPGFRVGVLYSYNDMVVKTARRMSSFSLVSSQTQYFLACMLSDKVFIKKYLEISRSRLKKRQMILVKGLQGAGIKCLKGNAGLFCWVNLSHLLSSNSIDGELELWNVILHDIGLNVNPGSSFRCSEPGWFRVCFANMTENTLLLSLQRIQEFISRRRRSLTNLPAQLEKLQIQSHAKWPAITMDKS